MALPQQVIDRLGKEPPKTPGWSVGALSFSIVVLIFTVAIYGGITYGYEPYVNSEITALNTNITTLAQSISPSDVTSLVTFYSQIANIQSTLTNHVFFSQFLTWLEHDTEGNVYFSTLTFASQNQITLTGFAKSEADINQQAAIFQSDPEVTNLALSSVVLVPTSGEWQFSISITLNPALFQSPLVTTAASSTVTTSTTQ